MHCGTETRHEEKARLRLVVVRLFLCAERGFLAQLQAGAQSQGASRPATTPQEERQQREPQPGATQGGVLTTETDAQAKFNMDYFVGEWKFEASVSESPLGAGGPMSGSETVRNVWDGRFWDITIKGQGADGAVHRQGHHHLPGQFRRPVLHEVRDHARHRGAQNGKSRLRSRRHVQPALRDSALRTQRLTDTTEGKVLSDVAFRVPCDDRDLGRQGRVPATGGRFGTRRMKRRSRRRSSRESVRAHCRSCRGRGLHEGM